jgi:hypothetical protein
MGGGVGMASSGEFSQRGVGPLSINKAKKLTVAKWNKTRIDARKTYNKKGNLHKSLEPRRIRMSGPFGRTLPGELATNIIGAGLDCPRVVCHEAPGWVETDIETSPTCTTEGQEGATATRKGRRADRMAAWENKESIAGLLCDHPSRSFATHAQVAGVIAKSLPLHAVATFLEEFNSFVPPPPKKGGKKAKDTCADY